MKLLYVQDYNICITTEKLKDGNTLSMLCLIVKPKPTQKKLSPHGKYNTRYDISSTPHPVWR